MQAYAGLPQSGILDNETKKLMNTSRCGMADVGRADIARRKRRYNIQGTKWTKQVLHAPNTVAVRELFSLMFHHGASLLCNANYEPVNEVKDLLVKN